MAHSATYYFEEAPVPKAMLHMALPLILSMFVGVIFGLVDNIFIGMLGDAEKVATAVMALPVLALLMGIANIFGVGCGSYISRLLGEQKPGEVRAVSSFAFWATCAAGVVVSVLGLLFLDPIVDMLGATEQLRADTRNFVSVFFIGGVPIMLSFAMGQIVRAEGAASEAMIGMVAGIVINLILDPLFIFGLHLGVAGAAWANMLSNALMTLYYMWYLTRRSQQLSIRLGDFRCSATILKESLSIGVPVFLTGLLMVASSLSLNNFAALHGEIVVAVLGIAIQVNNLPQFLISGLCEGVQPLIGYNFAAGNGQRMHQIIRLAGWISLGLGVVLSSALFVVSGQVLGLFIHDPAAVAQGTAWFQIAMLAQITYGGIYLFNSIFQAVGKAVPTFVMSTAQGALFIPAVVLGNMWLGVWGVAAALPVSEAGTAVLGLAIYLAIRKGLQRPAASDSAPLATGA
ncbi:MATE family efflux transporter [Chloroflexia bacterium SDU3-3]|nr:MATE family efflux transporter [Chloroflexia bacterium SDU3-3]